jgi:hypothetical protein
VDQAEEIRRRLEKVAAQREGRPWTPPLNPEPPIQPPLNPEPPVQPPPDPESPVRSSRSDPEPPAPLPPPVPSSNADRSSAAPRQPATVPDRADPQAVVIVDVKIKFWSLVVLMVKIAFAAIPATIIIAAIWMVILTVVQGLFH